MEYDHDYQYEIEADEASDAAELDEIRAAVQEVHPSLSPENAGRVSILVCEQGAYSVGADFNEDGFCEGTYIEIDEARLAAIVREHRRRSWLREIAARAVRPVTPDAPRGRSVRARSPRDRRVTASASRSAGGGSSGRPRPSDDEPALAGFSPGAKGRAR